MDLGELILHTAEKVVAGGILVFFPSYGNLKNWFYHWKARKYLPKSRKQTLLNRMEKLATVFQESSGDKSDFEHQMERFAETCRNDEKAIFLAVLRGKISEGIDFPDNAARAVITFGIPYQAWLLILIYLQRIFYNGSYVS